MTFEPHIPLGKILSNEQICDIFLCSPRGGMRKSNRTNSLVLVSDHTKLLYNDRWIGNVFHFTGMGRAGDQNLHFRQNKTLFESPNNEIEIFLFEVFKPREYIFQGEVKVAGEPYQEIQSDIHGERRKVWIFPLKLINGNPTPITYEQFEAMNKKRAMRAKGLSIEELKKRIEDAPETPGDIYVVNHRYGRNENVTEFAKRRANGVCELCGQPAPFKDKDGDPYLEAHHIIWLSKGGKDTKDNTAALCPNCHKKMHILDLEIDKQKLLDKDK